MMKLKKCTTATLAVSVLTLALMGCQKHEGRPRLLVRKLIKQPRKPESTVDGTEVVSSLYFDSSKTKVLR